MESIEYCVIGAGVTGLTIARKLAIKGHEVIILEADRNIAAQTSSRNSGVIHAGLYYPLDSLKSNTCVSGNSMLYDYCEEKNIRYKKCGKLVVATKPGHDKKLVDLKERAEANGVVGLKLLGKSETLDLEPALCAEGALYSPSTGIIDVEGFLQAIQNDFENKKGIIVKRSKVIKIIIKNSEKFIKLESTPEIKCKYIINAAGHQAIPLAHSIEENLLLVEKEKRVNTLPLQYFAKGNYFRYSEHRDNSAVPFSHLIYPVPEKSGLGIHFTLDMNGQARFGPDVEWVNSATDYAVNENRVAMFYHQIREYWPDIPSGSLIPDFAGIRPKLAGPGQGMQDFMIQGSDVHGIEGLIHLFGLESPGLTSSLALAEHVCHILQIDQDKQ